MAVLFIGIILEVINDAGGVFGISSVTQMECKNYVCYDIMSGKGGAEDEELQEFHDNRSCNAIGVMFSVFCLSFF